MGAREKLSVTEQCTGWPERHLNLYTLEADGEAGCKGEEGTSCLDLDDIPLHVRTLYIITRGMLKALCGLSKVVMGKDHESQKQISVHDCMHTVLYCHIQVFSFKCRSNTV